MIHGSRRLVASNSRFNVYFDELLRDGVVAVPDYLTVAPKDRDGRDVTGVAVLPVVDGRLGLLRLYRHPVRSWMWEVPRGFIEPGESAEASALRELEEETGLVCPSSALHPAGVVTPDAGVFDARVALFVALECRAARPFVSAELGHQSLHLLSPAEVERMIAAGDVQDTYTLICALTYRSLRGGSAPL